MMCPMQSCNTGVGGKDFGNTKHEYCYLVKFYDEDGRLLCMEPYTIPAYDADEALQIVDEEVQEDCETFDYFEADIQLEMYAKR